MHGGLATQQFSYTHAVCEVAPETTRSDSHTRVVRSLLFADVLPDIGLFCVQEGHLPYGRRPPLRCRHVTRKDSERVSPAVCVLAVLPLPSTAGVAIAAVAPSAFERTGAESVTAVPLARGVPGCDEAHDGVVQPLSDSSAALRSTQSSAGTEQGHKSYLPLMRSRRGRAGAALVELHTGLWLRDQVKIRILSGRCVLTDILLLGLGDRLGR